jgi:hypothetical protein
MNSNSIKTSNRNIYKETLIIGNRMFTFLAGYFNSKVYILYEQGLNLEFVSEFTLNDDELIIYNIFMEEMRLKYEL